MSKRDVQTCFDVLKAPEELQRWFGRPPVTLHELRRISGLSLTDLATFIADGADVGLFAPLFPTSTVWPMGFSWSSCVAQACAVACCFEAGVEDGSFMCMDRPPPSGQEACGVATDDAFFIHKDKDIGQQRLLRLDAVLEQHGMPKNEAKDVTLQPEMNCVGVPAHC